MRSEIRLLDAVALTRELPSDGLGCGQVGTIVEVLAHEVFEVDFSDGDGCTYATAAVRAEHLLVLHNHPIHTAR